MGGRFNRQPYPQKYGFLLEKESVYTDSESEYTSDGEEEYTDESDYTEEDNLSIFSRRGVRRATPYTNSYGNEREGFNSPSRYSHKPREAKPTSRPFISKENEFSGSHAGQTLRQLERLGARGPTNSRYGGYTPGTQLESGNTYYERIYLRDSSGRGLRAWNEFMGHSKEEWQTVKKVQRLISGKRFRGNTINLPGVSTGITLLVDMDETLIHSEEWRAGVPYDETVEIVNPMGRIEKIGVFVRPYCLEFLERMAEKFEIGIFTAAREDYASKVIDKLDPTGRLISGRLYR